MYWDQVKNDFTELEPQQQPFKETVMSAEYNSINKLKSQKFTRQIQANLNFRIRVKLHYFGIICTQRVDHTALIYMLFHQMPGTEGLRQ